MISNLNLSKNINFFQKVKKSIQAKYPETTCVVIQRQTETETERDRDRDIDR